ncbi:MAG: 2,3,4,5-tetrahydropyridine-2,6-dicarboxylate N-succinyltransferase, partial [Pseudomonadota bacterium]|nr:2,3,4,5-tetrahydropyridine-2,6-dicarboxylate N-succinyltransferase [Pseudomonadota bacterium]
MSNAQLEQAIEAAWDARDTITSATTGETREAIEDTLNALDSGSLRVAEMLESGDWHVNQWAKKAV